jgi:hypothetical protein
MDTYSFTPQSATGLLSRLRSFWAYAKLYLFRRRTIPLIIPVSSAVPRLERSKEPKGELNKNPPESAEYPSESAEYPRESAQELPFQGNRAARRQAAAWERERMKRDKFVTPKGELPVKTPRPPRAPKITPPDSDPAAIPTTLEPVRLVHEANQIMMDDGVGFPENEIWGEFAFRDTILDQLDRYWVYLARMKKHDNDAYEFYKQLGATVVPPVHWFLHKGARWKEDDKPMKAKPLKPLSPWWKQHRPGFGCVTYGIYSKVEEDEMAARFEGKDRNKRMWVPKFLYFVKYRQPPANVQPCSGGDVYKMTVWWDRPQDEKMSKKHQGVPEDYAVFVSADGSDVHVLPMHETEFLPIRRKHASHGYKRGKTFTVPHRHWTIPKHYVNWAKHHGLDANTFLSSLFLDAAHSVEMAEYSMVRVAVHNEGLCAAFGVDVRKLPYFFQDRDIVLTDSGAARKRAFHLVRPHVRASGAAVKMHFRGEKDFTWAGYQVNITIPARDHFMLTDFDVGVDQMNEVPKRERKNYMVEKKVAAMLVDKMKRGVGGSRH